jgi:hypothetical protein
MRNPFKKTEATEPVKTVVTPLPPSPEQPAYQVGVTESGKVTLRIGGAYGYGMLTMNDVGVLKLIDLLEAAMTYEVPAAEGHDGRGPG